LEKERAKRSFFLFLEICVPLHVDAKKKKMKLSFSSSFRQLSVLSLSLSSPLPSLLLGTKTRSFILAK